MTRLVCFMATVALLAATTSVQADITWAAGAPGGTSGGSLSFDGLGDGSGNGEDNLLTGISGPGFLDGSYTVSAWLNADDVSTQQYAIGTTSQSLHLGLNGGDAFQGHWGSDLAGSSTAIADGQWFHATFTFEADGAGAGTSTIFINGTEIAAGVRNDPNNLNQILIGSRSNLGGDNGGNRERWTGRIDDVAFFTGVLTDTEIADLAANTTDALTLGANAYYDFEDDQTGTIAAAQTAVGATSIGAGSLTGIVAVAVPEPSSIAIMFGLGVATLVRRKRS